MCQEASVHEFIGAIENQRVSQKVRGDSCEDECLLNQASCKAVANHIPTASLPPFRVKQHKLQHELALMAHKRHAAQQKLMVLQKLLTDVQSVQQKDAAKALQASKVTRQAQEKDAGYKAQMGKLQQKLERNGFSPQVKNGTMHKLTCITYKCTSAAHQLQAGI